MSDFKMNRVIENCVPPEMMSFQQKGGGVLDTSVLLGYLWKFRLFFFKWWHYTVHIYSKLSDLNQCCNLYLNLTCLELSMATHILPKSLSERESHYQFWDLKIYSRIFFALVHWTRESSLNYIQRKEALLSSPNLVLFSILSKRSGYNSGFHIKEDSGSSYVGFGECCLCCNLVHVTSS